MTGRLLASLIACLAWLGLALPAAAQEPGPELRARAEQVVRLLGGGENPSELFTPEFLAQVPEAQVRAISTQIVGQYGAPRRLAGIDAQTPTAAILHIEHERATLHASLVIEPQAPHRISGLVVTGADRADDSLAAIMEEVRALPGETSVAVARLGEAAPQLVAAVEPDRALAIGSTFKLFILAEISRQVAAGERRWDEVVTLDRRSIPSGLLQSWPRNAPITVHSLASLMISQSDNTATDMLLHLAGRENVERMMERIGVEAGARNRPLLSTLEVSALKALPEATIQAWRSADEAGRRRLLAEQGELTPEGIDLAHFTGAPRYIDLFEWFASPADLVRVLDWLRREGGDEALAILAINPGVTPTITGGLQYVGYKGGSEPGVLNLSWLIRNRAGQWHVVTGSWNNPAATVEEARFLGLMTRAIQLLR